ncbi:MAG TPA: hypothetical protein VGJ79_00645 [Candidatus Dormibacteraeota bacterium]|jgi:hypothetical protein
MTDIGYIPNHPSEATIPISNWNLFYTGDEPFFWIVALDPAGPLYKLPKLNPATTPVPPEPAPVLGTLATFSIPNDIAEQMGLPLPASAPMGMKRAAKLAATEARRWMDPPLPTTEPNGPS